MSDDRSRDESDENLPDEELTAEDIAKLLGGAPFDDGLDFDTDFADDFAAEEVRLSDREAEERNGPPHGLACTLDHAETKDPISLALRSAPKWRRGPPSRSGRGGKGGCPAQSWLITPVITRGRVLRMTARIGVLVRASLRATIPA